MRQGDTPYLISSNFGLLIDQDEKGSLSSDFAHGRPPFGLSVRPGLTRPLCWRCIANMMAECRVLTASHAGPVSARLLASRGVRSDRRDPGLPRAFPRPVQRGHDDPPGQP